MNEIWIATCELRASDGVTPFWGAGSRHVKARLLMRAANRQGFEASIRASVAAGGAQVLAIEEIAAVTKATTDAEVAAAMAHANVNAPLMVGLPVPAKQAGSFGAEWVEADWDTVLSGADPCWALISGVSWPDIADHLVDLPARDAVCLYASTDRQTRSLAPWLVRLIPGSPITNRICERAHGSHALVVFRSRQPIEALRAHLRRYTMLRTPEAQDAPVYFRFYDPRVLVDMVEAMSRTFLDRFLSPISAVAVPLTPEVLMPDQTGWTQDPITPFDETEDCQGRLALAEVGAFKAAARSGSLEITEPDYKALEARMAERSRRKLARTLARELGDLTTRDACLAVAQGAAEAAAPFGLQSVKQVTMFARCQLLFGLDFVLRYPDASRILNDGSRLPWQKKNDLQAWYGTMLFPADAGRTQEALT